MRTGGDRSAAEHKTHRFGRQRPAVLIHKLGGGATSGWEDGRGQEVAEQKSIAVDEAPGPPHR